MSGLFSKWSVYVPRKNVCALAILFWFGAAPFSGRRETLRQRRLEKSRLGALAGVIKAINKVAGRDPELHINRKGLSRSEAVSKTSRSNARMGVALQNFGRRLVWNVAATGFQHSRAPVQFRRLDGVRRKALTVKFG